MNSPPALAPFPLDQADLCVKCGLCLPHCPTYTLSRHEGESPRGRISLMQGLASGALPASDALQAHLDNCLGCRACESVCPAKVPYGRLIDAGRAQLAALQPQRARQVRAIATLLTRARWRSALRTLLWMYTRSGLQAIVRRVGLLGRGRLARLESLVPAPVELPADVPTPEAPRSRAQLFGGCVGSVLDQATLNATRQVCARLGIDLEEPESQDCCGALHQHGGLPADAQRQVARNLDAFPGTAPVAWCASGCGATLREYGQLSADPRAQAFARRATDIHALLNRQWPMDLVPRPLAARALLYLPCTQRHVTGGVDQIHTLLSRIPQLQLETIGTQGCCGAAGSHVVTHPQTADRLLDEVLDQIAARSPDLVLTSNIGCALHLGGGLRRRGLNPPVLHPVQLLARQLAVPA